MGAGASTNQNEDQSQYSPEVAKQANRIHELKKEVEEKDKVIAQLEARLKAKEMKSARPSMSGSFKEAKKRRGEISAEAWEGEDKKETEEYKKTVIPKDPETFKLIQDAVKVNLLFKGLRAAEQEECVHGFFKVQVKAGDRAIKHGDIGDNLYVVEHGTLEIFLPVKGEEVAVGEVTRGMAFGELALMYNEPRAATITAKVDCTLWAIGRKTFRAIHLHHKLLRKKVYAEYLRKIPQLRALKKSEMTRLVDAVEEECFEKGEAIIREGETGDYFYIIVSGAVSYHKKAEGKVGDGGPGDFFGHKALLTEETRAATVLAETDVQCLSMCRMDFVSLFGSLQDMVHRQDTLYNLNTEDDEEEHHRHHKAIRYEDLEKTFERKGIKREIILGQGAFGKVQIVKHKETGETYALKCLDKAQIVQYSLQAHVDCERQVMTMIDHPFLLKLHNSYWDDHNVYLLLELCLGGELFNLLRRLSNFPEKSSKFYAAIVVQAFAHLHERKIIYRDLKPENLMLDNEGYVKVVDFGLAKVVKDRSWTLCGTPDYLAPEIIQTLGHDKAADYWALGILIYEMTAGTVPFEGSGSLELYNSIIHDDVSFPSNFSRSCIDIISKLLTKNPTKRLGNTKEGIKSIVKHKWFGAYDWVALLNRSLKAPLVPHVESPEDTSNFEDFGEAGSQSQKKKKCDWTPSFPHQIIDGKTVGME